MERYYMRESVILYAFTLLRRDVCRYVDISGRQWMKRHKALCPFAKGDDEGEREGGRE